MMILNQETSDLSLALKASWGETIEEGKARGHNSAF